MQSIRGCSSDQWPQCYHHRDQTICNNQASIIISGITPTDTPSARSESPVNYLKPSSKKKSKACKRIPTTVLNADVSNFRVLVQQLTGRGSTPSIRKGPLNINFAKGNDAGDEVDDVAPRMMLPFGCDSINNTQHKFAEVNRYDQNCFSNHQNYSSNEGQRGNVVEKAAHNPALNMDVFDDFDVNDLCLEELAWEGSNYVDNGRP